MISARDIRKTYGELQVLKGISLDIADAEIVSVVGESGAGKTTLLQILGTLDSPDSGTLEYSGKSVSRMKPSEMAAFRNRHIGFIFQFHQLLPEFTCLENVCMPAFIAGTPKKEAEERAAELLAYLGLGQRTGHKPNELSGGEQQRCAVARALMNKPSVVFADEPSGNLDSRNAAELHKLFLDLRRDFGYSFVIVTHNEELAAMADSKLVMKDGLIVDGL